MLKSSCQFPGFTFIVMDRINIRAEYADLRYFAIIYTIYKYNRKDTYAFQFPICHTSFNVQIAMISITGQTMSTGTAMYRLPMSDK